MVGTPIHTNLELLNWELRYPESFIRLWRNDKSSRLIIVDRVAFLAHGCDLRLGRKTCYNHAAHVVFRHTDDTLRRLCDTRNPMQKREGWFALEANVVHVLLSGKHAEPLPEGASAIGDTSFDVAGHRLCKQCDMMLDHLHRVSQRRHAGKPNPEKLKAARALGEALEKAHDDMMTWIADHQSVVNSLDNETLADFLHTIARVTWRQNQ